VTALAGDSKVKITPRQIDILRDVFEDVKPSFGTPAKSQAYYRIKSELNSHTHRFLEKGVLTVKGLEILRPHYADNQAIDRSIARRRIVEDKVRVDNEQKAKERNNLLAARDAERNTKLISAYSAALTEFGFRHDWLRNEKILELGNKIAHIREFT
jgi:hypothetical protein